MIEPMEPLPGVCVVRVPLLPLHVSESLLAAIDSVAVLRAMYAARADCRLGISLASPDLARAARTWLDGRPPKNRKAPLKLLAYAVRMSMRCTPFGMFAALGPVDVGESQTLHIVDGAARTCRFRADAAWLFAIVNALETDPQRRDRLTVRSTDAFREHDGRMFATNYATQDVSSGGTLTLRSPASLRKTVAVEAALRASRESIRYGELVTRLGAEFEVSGTTARGLVDELWRAGVLIPDLRPPPLASALDHVLEHLPPEEQPLRARLNAHRESLERLSAPDGVLTEADVAFAVAELRAEVPGARDVVHVDSTVALGGTLASRVLDDAGILASLLLRNGREMELRDLRGAWERRFDTPGVLVPLLDVVDTDIGFGDPGKLEPAASDSTERDAIRVMAAAEALSGGHAEIALTDEDLRRWFRPAPDSAVRATMEVAFHVIAASAEAVDAGDYLVCAAPLAYAGAGRSLGRFSDMLPAATIKWLRDTVQTDDDAIHAELIYAPPQPRAANICTRPLLYPYHIDLGLDVEGAEALSTRDLFVGLDESGFYLYSRRYKKRVIVHESHLMSTPAGAPALCRFLALIANQGRAPGHFGWGAAEHFPALPRVRYGRVVLCARRWRLPAELFAGTAEEAVAGIRNWRAHWSCPAHVRIGSGDTQFAVNLDSPAFVALIQDQRRNSPGPVDAREILETSQTSVVRDDAGDAYAAEFVASFRTRCTSGSAAAPKVAPRTFDSPPLHGLGSEYVYVKLYCARHEMDRILVSEIAPAAERLIAAGLADRWFFVRYADPESHIRMRLHAPPETAAKLREELFALTERWLRSKTCVRVAADTYAPETARYGGVAALATIERAFMESSRACVAELEAVPIQARERIRRATTTAHRLFAPVVERLGMPWWIAALGRERAARDAFFRDDLRAVRAAFGVAGEREGDASALGALVDSAEDGALESPLADVVFALLHMHVNRFGIQPKDEAIVRDLIAQTYRSFIARS